MTNPAPFNPTKTYINPESIEKTIIAYNDKDKTFSTHEKQTSTWIPKFLEKSFIVKIIHWLWNSNERISRVSQAFQNTLNEHIASCKSLKEQATLYANLYTFNRCVVQKHNERRWNQLPLINFAGLQDTVLKKLDQSIQSLRFIPQPETIVEHVQRIVNCKSELESIPEAKDDSQLTLKRRALAVSIGSASDKLMTFIVTEIDRLESLETFSEKDYAYLTTLKQLHKEGKLPDIHKDYVEKLVDMERKKKCVHWKRQFETLSNELETRINTLDPLSNELIALDLKIFDSYFEFEKTVSDAIPAQKELKAQAAELKNKMTCATQLLDCLALARKTCLGEDKIEDKIQALDQMTRQSGLWSKTFNSWIVELKEKALNVDLENYEKAVKAECQARNAASDKYGAIDFIVRLKAPVIASMVGADHPLAKKYAELDVIAETIRKLAKDTEQLASIANADFSQATLEQVRNASRWMFDFHWKDEALAIVDVHARELGKACATVLKRATQSMDPTENELKQFEREQTRLSKAFKTMQSPRDFQRYLSLEFFKRHKGFSLYESVQRHLVHRWSDAEYKTKLNSLLKMFPEAILNEHEALHACAHFWYNPLERVQVTEEKIKELSQHVGMATLFQWQMDILSRMLSKPADNRKIEHDWYLCRTLLRKAEDFTFDQTNKRIRKGFERHVNWKTVEKQHNEALSVEAVQKELYIPFIEKVWTKQPTEQDLQSQPKLLLLMVNQFMFRLYDEAFPSQDHAQRSIKFAEYLADVYFFLDNVNIIRNHMGYTHHRKATLLKEFSHLIYRIVNDGAAFVNQEIAKHSMSIIAKAAYQVTVQVLAWLKDDKDTAKFMNATDQLSDDQLQQFYRAVSLCYCRNKMYSSREAMLKATTLQDLLQIENAERERYLKEWARENIKETVGTITQATMSTATHELNHEHEKATPPPSKDF